MGAGRGGWRERVEPGAQGDVLRAPSWPRVLQGNGSDREGRE